MPRSISRPATLAGGSSPRSGSPGAGSKNARPRCARLRPPLRRPCRTRSAGPSGASRRGSRAHGRRARRSHPRRCPSAPAGTPGTSASTASFNRTVVWVHGLCPRGVPQNAKSWKTSGIVALRGLGFLGRRSVALSQSSKWLPMPSSSVSRVDAGGGAQFGRHQDAAGAVHLDVHRVAEEHALPPLRLHRQRGDAFAELFPGRDAGRSSGSRADACVIVSWPAAVALRTSRCRVGTESRPLASRLSDEAP